MAHPGRYTRYTHHGAAQYVLNIKFDDGVAISCELSIDAGAVAESGRDDGHCLAFTPEASWGYYCLLQRAKG